MRSHSTAAGRCPSLARASAPPYISNSRLFDHVRQRLAQGGMMRTLTLQILLACDVASADEEAKHCTAYTRQAQGFRRVGAVPQRHH